MITVDFSRKILHVAVNIQPIDGKKRVHKGLIFQPAKVFSKINIRAEDHFSEFFMAPQLYKVMCLETEMGPGELGEAFKEHFGSTVIERSMVIGGILSPFTIMPLGFENFWLELKQNPKRFLRSPEKRVFSRRPTR